MGQKDLNYIREMLNGKTSWPKKPKTAALVNQRGGGHSQCGIAESKWIWQMGKKGARVARKSKTWCGGNGFSLSLSQHRREEINFTRLVRCRATQSPGSEITQGKSA